MTDIYLLKTEEKGSPAARRLLRMALKEGGLSGGALSCGPYGKPLLSPGPHIGISHRRGAVAVAVGDMPIGLDLERLRDFDARLPARIFSKGEMEYFHASGASREAFFTLWTLKESYYKFTGRGLPGFPNGTDFYMAGEGKWRLPYRGCPFTVLRKEDLLIALCGDEQEKVRLHFLSSP